MIDDVVWGSPRKQERFLVGLLAAFVGQTSETCELTTKIENIKYELPN
jgi:hypothetical protein